MSKPFVCEYPVDALYRAQYIPRLEFGKIQNGMEGCLRTEAYETFEQHPPSGTFSRFMYDV